MSSPVDRDALSRTAKRLRISTGDQITQRDAEKIVANHLEKADRKNKNRS